MKRKWFLLPVLLLAVASLLMLGCAPSEPDPGEPDTVIEIPPGEEDEYLVFKGGEGSYQFKFDTPRVTHGKEYVITLKLEDCDSAFVGNRMGGKLCYKLDFDDADEKSTVLSGWDYCAPEVVTSAQGIFRWIFKAGEKNSDNVAIANPATTPEGATQYFALTIQNSSWNNLKEGIEFNIKGNFTVRERADPPAGTTMQKVSDITLDFTGEGHDADTGIGNILGEELEKLRAANLTEYAVLKVTVTCDITADKIKDGNSVGSIGNRPEYKGTNPNAQIKIPKEGVSAGSNVTFTADVLVIDALDHILSGENYLFVNIWDGTSSGIELWDYR